MPKLSTDTVVKKSQDIRGSLWDLLFELNTEDSEDIDPDVFRDVRKAVDAAETVLQLAEARLES